jgi:Tfp pilus assembly protein FimT
MVTIAVLAILLAIGVPSFTNLVRDTRVVGAANELLFNLQLARSEAVKRRTLVSLCAVDPGAPDTCDTDAATDGWSDAWLVVFENDDDDIVLIRSTIVSDAISVDPAPATSDIVFNAVGTVENSTSYSFLVESDDGETSRFVCLRVSGQSRVERDTCSEGE